MFTFQRYVLDDYIKTQKNVKALETVFKTKDVILGKDLGSGGFGSVCECYIKNKKYALKKFHKKQKNEQAARESFDCEKNIINLSHPNIVHTLLTFTLEDDTQCILMEYISRINLQKLIDNHAKKLTFSTRQRVAIDVVKGLLFAHQNNIAHLDLKPANILITSTGHCKIADFGCCQKVCNNDQPSTPTKSSLTGTYSYRAPELLRGEPATTAADIYSYGICLWQLLSRQRPYGTEHHQVIIFKVVAYNLRPTLPNDNVSKEDERHIELMKLCWQKEKIERPTADDVLKRLLKG